MPVFEEDLGENRSIEGISNMKKMICVLQVPYFVIKKAAQGKIHYFLKQNAYLYVLILSLVWCMGSYGAEAKGQDQLTVFAPASLTDLLPKLGEMWSAQSGVPVVFQFAATSQMARQISEGAVADILISAHESWTKSLLKEGAILPPTVRHLFENRLVVATASIQPSLSPKIDANAFWDTAKLEQALLATPKLALAGEQVPAGVYAEEALRTLNIWEKVKTKIVRGDHVRSVAMWLKTSVAPIGIVYKTDALALGLPIVYEFERSPQNPIIYVGAVVKKGGHPKYGAAFLDFLTSGKAQKVYQDAGFVRPVPVRERSSS